MRCDLELIADIILLMKMSSFSSCGNDSNVFQIKGTTEFTNRSNLIFNELNDLEEKHGKWKVETPTLDVEKPDPSASEMPDCTTRRRFKRPRSPVSLKRVRPADLVPDYIMNPHKWKKYSLADTPSVTEESNAAVAHQFLKGLKKNREDQTIANDIGSPTYRKPMAVEDIEASEQEPEETCTSSFTCSSVHKMPELVVGEKIRKPKKLVASVAKTGKAVKLDHLEDLDV